MVCRCTGRRGARAQIQPQVGDQGYGGTAGTASDGTMRQFKITLQQAGNLGPKVNGTRS
jgi:hypothetical protein